MDSFTYSLYSVFDNANLNYFVIDLTVDNIVNFPLLIPVVENQ